MTETKAQNLPVATHVRDGGTAVSRHSNFREAYASVLPVDRRRAFILLAAAGVTLALLLLSRLIWLAEPLLDKVRYGTLSEVLYYLILAIIFIGYTVGLDVFLKRRCGIRLFAKKPSHISVSRALGVLALCAAAMFTAGAALGFKFKMELEIGYGVTALTALTNVATYIYYAEHLLLGFVIAALVQTALSTLLPAKHTVPWGAIALVTVFGLLEFTLELFATTHMYPWLYYAFTYVYAAIYVLTGRSFHLSFWASVLLMVL